MSAFTHHQPLPLEQIPVNLCWLEAAGIFRFQAVNQIADRRT
jgi:hypothetical protein